MELIDLIKEAYNNENNDLIDQLLTLEVLNEKNDAALYVFKANAIKNDRFDLKMDYAQTAININPNMANAYAARGSAWLKLDDKTKALADYIKAAELDIKNFDVYYKLSHLYFSNKEYDLAFENICQSIKLNPKNLNALVLRGVLWSEKKNYKKAILDYTKALLLNNLHPFVYLNRGIDYSITGQYKKAIDDYNLFLRLIEGKNLSKIKNIDHGIRRAKSDIVKLTKILSDKKYLAVDKLINRIKKTLEYENNLITHYTSLTAAQQMVFNNSHYRISEGTFLNDTSEGKQLLEYLHLKPSQTNDLKENFAEKPFIGSFVTDNKNDDLTLWRMYGKEPLSEANGCSLTFIKKEFINQLKEKFQSFNKASYIFYRVAYWNKTKFIIPEDGENKIEEILLNQLMIKLSKSVKNINKTQKFDIIEQLNDITYLFKSAEYQYEHEVRLVVDGHGFQKKFLVDKLGKNSPRVCIELFEIAALIENVTIGPKVEKSDEWSTAFNYYFKEKEKSVNITVSNLPFK